MAGTQRSLLRLACALLAFTALLLCPAQADPLANVIRAMAATPAERAATDIAVHEETSGHLAFANRAGERFTASLTATGEEVRAALKALAPRAAETGLTLHLSTSTAFAQPNAARPDVATTVQRIVKPAPVAVRALIDQRSLPTQLRAKGGPLIEIKPGVALAAPDPATFRDAVARLLKPIATRSIRVIAFEPGAAMVLPADVRVDAATKAATVDRVDPGNIAEAFRAARGQVIVVTGRLEETGLAIAAARSATTIAITDLERAAITADVTLIVLDTGSTIQPGGRNMFWLPVSVPGLEKSNLEKAADGPSLSDVLHLAIGRRPLLIDAAATDERVQLSVRRAETETANGWLKSSGSLSRWTTAIWDVASDLIGKAPARTILVFTPAAARQIELDRRIIKALPSTVQFGYAALLLLGLIGLPMARLWFARLWPAEAPADYANRAGFIAARAIRALVFWAAFLPLTAIVAAPARLLRRDA